MEGRIHSFQSLGTVDGPGVRSVVFMQGCPLRCACCHNPDTWDVSGGQTISTDDLVSKIMRFSDYYGTTGGVTVSGGEPLLQAAFVSELFEKLHQNGIHTALDTSGCILNDTVCRLLDVTDLVLLDSKYATDEDYQAFVGCEKQPVDRFLDMLQSKQIPTWIRRVIIPGLNDDDTSTVQLKSLSLQYPCIQKTELLPFRKLCLEKYESLHIPFSLANTPEPTAEQMQHLEQILSAH